MHSTNLPAVAAGHSACFLILTRMGRIDLDEFVSGCMQLHGPAKSLQLAKMSFENKLLVWNSQLCNGTH